MSYFDYRMSLELAHRDYPFYALMMAAMRQADTDNAKVLSAMWPAVWEEFVQRYNASGGKIGDEVEL